MQIVDGDITSMVNRFSNLGTALAINGVNGYLVAEGMNAMVDQDSDFNMSCWLGFTDEVYNGNKDAIIFNIVNKQSRNLVAKCTISNKKITIFAHRKKVDGNTVMVPIIKMDIPVEKIEETNGFLFFGMTIERNNGNRTKLYISRPGGVLFSRYYYIDPFDGINPENHEVWLMGGHSSDTLEKADKIDDLMWSSYRKDDKKIWSPEQMLNAFYLQSPLYEGISYEISGNGSGDKVGYMGLASQRNAGVEFSQEAVMLGDNISKTPFGYNRFYVEKNSTKRRSYKFHSVKMGYTLSPDVLC